MKLLNRTRVPDKTLRALLVAAGRRVGARTGNVVACVSPGSRNGGTAYECVSVRWSGRRWLKTDGGAFRATLVVNGDPLVAAEQFYRTAAHEWCHIREYQRGGSWTHAYSRGRGKRRPAHRLRPEERRVAERLAETANAGDPSDVILALALAMEAAS